jgi:MATE family multidrug resistance protein
VEGWIAARGPQGMWIGLIAGLCVAAVLLGWRFLRRSRAMPVVAPDDRRLALAEPAGPT